MWVVCFAILIFLSFSMAVRRSDQYTCESVLDYHSARLLNPQCSFNPDVGDTPPNITARQGYKVRQYEVKTEDGYILFVIRISTTVEANHGIVFLQHPYTADSVVWVDKGKNKSLGFILADQGYDVWLGNSRATRLSLGHINLTTKDAKYWGYSFHEIAIYDIPASLEKVKEISGADKITYVSHSGGSKSALIYASLMKYHAKSTVDLFIAIALVSYINYPRFPIWIVYPLPLLLKIIRDDNFQKLVASIFHTTMRYTPILLFSILEFLEYTSKQINPLWWPLAVFNFPQGFNTKQLIHYIQIARAKRFQQFDYGPESNREVYGAESPPEYPVWEIDIPFQIVYSPKGAFFGTMDAFLLHSKLNGIAGEDEPYDVGAFNHIGFFYGKEIDKLHVWILEKIRSIDKKRAN